MCAKQKKKFKKVGGNKNASKEFELEDKEFEGIVGGLSTPIEGSESDPENGGEVSPNLSSRVVLKDVKKVGSR